MRSLIGLFWALGGALIGGIVTGLAASLYANLTNVTTRDGAAGYFVIGIGLLGAILGGVAGVVLFARRAPTGEAGSFALSGVLGVVALIALVVLSVWAFTNLREAPLKYDGAMASLELELRVQTSHMPADTSSRWLSVEVHTAKTRPEGTPLWSNMRSEGTYTIIPVVQGPLYRSGSRIVVVTLNGRQTEVFTPRMKRTPDPAADWSEWVAPSRVDPPFGVESASPLAPLVELRYRVRAYGT